MNYDIPDDLTIDEYMDTGWLQRSLFYLSRGTRAREPVEQYPISSAIDSLKTSCLTDGMRDARGRIHARGRPSAVAGDSLEKSAASGEYGIAIARRLRSAGEEFGGIVEKTRRDARTRSR